MYVLLPPVQQIQSDNGRAWKVFSRLFCWFKSTRKSIGKKMVSNYVQNFENSASFNIFTVFRVIGMVERYYKKMTVSWKRDSANCNTSIDFYK